MDGARLFNAQIKLGVPAAEIVRHVDSVTFCLSKSLAAPFGSMVCGSAAFIDRVKRYRKLLGGGMRQAGIQAAAGIVALTHMVDRLAEDHHRAAQLAAALAQLPGVTLAAGSIETNMVFFDVSRSGIGNAAFLQSLSRRGVRMGLLGEGQIRAVTHYMISDQDIQQTITVAAEILQQHTAQEAR